MSDVIATVWDFDKTLIPGYMQDPIFLNFPDRLPLIDTPISCELATL